MTYDLDFNLLSAIWLRSFLRRMWRGERTGMTPSRTRIAAFIVLLCVPVADGRRLDADGDSIVDLSAYTPLQLGVRSEYITSFSHPRDGSGTATSSDEVVGVEELGGREYYKSVWYTDGFPGSVPLVTFLRKSDEALYAVPGEELDKGEHIQTPMHLRLGDSWVEERFSGVIRYTLISRVGVEVPAGTFTDCFKVVMSGEVSIGGASGEMYLCRAVGMVKQIERFSNGAVFQYELVKYTPGREGAAEPSLAPVG